VRGTVLQVKAKTLTEHIAHGTFRKDRHAHLLNEAARPPDISAAQWRYLRVELLGPEDAARGDHYIYRSENCMVHGTECEVMFATETEATVGCNPLDYPEPIVA
jgi:hypothetical protein